MWIVEYYETPTKQCPTQEFLDNCDKERVLPPIMHDIGQLEKFGYKLTRPQVGPLRDHIYELRTRVGRINYRLLYFFFYNEKIIISHGITKIKIVPSNQIDIAIEHRKDYFARNKRNE